MVVVPDAAVRQFVALVELKSTDHRAVQLYLHEHHHQLQKLQPMWSQGCGRLASLQPYGDRAPALYNTHLYFVKRQQKKTIQEAQLPQRNSASAAHVKWRGARRSSPLSLLWLHPCVWSNPKPARNVRQACRPLSALYDEAGIQGHSRSTLLVPAAIKNGVL